jgi:DNA uptake protein ComE-like DNA-binding protein
LSSTQRKGYLALLFLFVIALIGRIAVIFWPDETIQFQSTLPEEIGAWKAEQRLALLVPHSFDPNTASDTFIYKCKISRFAADNWIKYRTSGRRFETAQDLLAIYGMDTTWFDMNRDSISIIPIENESNVTKFYFDPNTASAQELEKLGMPTYLAERIVKYREAGGSFSSPEDLRKIYGFPESLYQELEPYCRIEEKNEVPEELVVVERVEVIIELNAADSLNLISVTGIGPVFAHRILAYRRKLGGFVNKDQLLEVYGIDEERLAGFKAQLKVDSSLISKLNINTATFKELLRHPYLNYEQVKSLVRFREQIGAFPNLEGISQLEHFTIDDVKRLSPYLAVE